MTDFEIKSEILKMRWIENFKITNEKYTQVSCYIFNEKNQLLIVKGEKNWTIPGGHPELNETKEETVEREVLEEACVTIKQKQYMGAVEVIEDEQQYYQLRYFAKVDKLLPFVPKFETSERLFIDLRDINKYIKWHDSVTFILEIKSTERFRRCF